MPLRISVCPYRLLFKHPFGTAHGLRDGTDALFVRVEEEGEVGHGEIALPPYVTGTIQDARQRIRQIAALRAWSIEELLRDLDSIDVLRDSPATRAGLHTALMDARAMEHGQSLAAELGIAGRYRPIAVMTIGICSVEEALGRLAELPPGTALKLKAGDELAIKRIRAITESCAADVLIDGNQGFASVSDAEKVVLAVPNNRLIALEQPFITEHDEWSRELSLQTGASVIADESFQGIEDLERVARFFDGVNIKLMKCGGLDRAHEIAVRADQLDLRVMLGCMSESSLGCGTMAQLASEASILDLDGPWLLRNDPWQGLAIEADRMIVPNGPGIGVQARINLDYVDA